MSKKKKLLISIISLVVLIAVQIYFLSTYDHFKAEGGLKIEMDIDPEDVTKKYARASLDFDYVMKDAIREHKKSGGDFLTVLAESNKKRLKKPLVQLLSYKEISELNLNSSDGEVIDFLQNDLEQNLELTERALQNHLDRIIEGEVIMDVNAKELAMTIELPRRRDSLTREDFRLPQANIEFFECMSMYQFSNFWNDAIELTKPDSLPSKEWELTNLNKSIVDDRPTLANTVRWNMNGQGMVLDRDKDFVHSMIYRGNVIELFPEDWRFRWSNHAEKSNEGKMWYLYLVRMPEKGAVITNEDILNAKLSPDDNGQPTLDIKMTPEGTQKWAKMTEENVGRLIAMCINGRVLSAPNVINPIFDGHTQLTGGGNSDYLKDVELALNYRALEVYPMSSQQVLVKANPPMLNATIQQILLIISIALLLFFGVQFFRTSRSN